MYIALYQNVTREVRESCGRVAKDVLIELANYTNALGICWPGAGRLASDTGYSVETVQAGLQALLDADYIRMHERYSSVRQRWEFEAWQLSPEVLCIRGELHSQALRSYDYCNSRNSFVTKDSQPTTEPSLSNQLQEPTKTNQQQQQKDKSPFNVKNTDESESPAAALQPDPNPTKKTKSKTTAPAGATTTRIDYAGWAVALPVESDESAAAALWGAVAGAMPMPVARYLVATRGAAAAAAAVKNYQKNAAAIINPGGYVRSLIERQQIDPVIDSQDESAALSDSWNPDNFTRTLIERQQANQDIDSAVDAS